MAEHYLGTGMLYIDMQKPKRHRHEASFWALSSGANLWCYRCGAIKVGNARWQKPTGIGGLNPAVKRPIGNVQKFNIG